MILRNGLNQHRLAWCNDVNQVHLTTQRSTTEPQGIDRLDLHELVELHKYLDEQHSQICGGRHFKG